MRSKSIKNHDIADVLDRHIRTIKRWIRDFRERRLGSLFTGQKDNENASKLTRVQKEEIKKVLQENLHYLG